MPDLVESFVHRRAMASSAPPALPLESRWYVVDAMNLHARQSWRRVPGRPKVVFVHGMGVSSLYMVPTAQRLEPYAQIFAPDLPGFGRSDKPDEALRLDALADVLARWMRLAEAGPAVLVGNSFGCQIAVHCAIRHPELVSGLVLQGPTIDASARNSLTQVLRWVEDVPHEDFSEAFVVGRDYVYCGFRRLWKTLQISLDDPIEALLPQVDVPSLVVRGAHDPIVPQAWAEQVARLLPRGRLAVIESGAHTVNYSTPDSFAALLREFVAHISSPNR
jgi:pimeloyl-ACP methyl ester carboxylesterase